MADARRVALALVPLAALAPAAAAGQRLTARELSAGGLVALADADFRGAALTAAWRPGGQTRVAVSAAGGRLESRAAARGEVTLQLLLTPAARRGTGLYAGAGIAWQGSESDRGGSGYLTVLLGLESAPGRRWGWYGEAGLAGGARLAAGVRRRWFPPWW